jgi:hypothetical protein
MRKMTRNRIRCLNCKDIIESTHRHDFKFCPCGSVFVDGGLVYQRYGGEMSSIEDLCEWEEAEEDEQDPSIG